MLEKYIERKLVNDVKNEGGLCFKFVSPGVVGVPDRLILMPKGKIAFVELKAPGKKPRPIQVKRMKEIMELGFKCFVIDEPCQIGGVIDAIHTT